MVTDALTRASIEAFFPHEKLLRSRAQRKPPANRKPSDWYSKPYFSGYVFADADLSQHQHALITIPQVLRIVGVGDEPVPIPAAEIEAVRRVSECKAEVVRVAPARAYSEGEEVLVKCGVFRGCTGRVCYLKNKQRLVVFMVGILGQGVATEIDASWLCPIPQNSKPISATVRTISAP